MAAVGCSSSSNPSDTASTRVPPSTSLTPYRTPAPTTPAITVTSTADPTSAVAPEPTGVPGLQDADPFCAAWAAYAGTTQMLAVGAAFGTQPAKELTAAEMFAAPAVVQAVRQIDTSWPFALAAEHDVVVDKVLGPMQRREQKAVDALRAAAVSDDDLATMAVAWRSVLAARNPDDPAVPRPTIGADVDAKVDAAAAAFAAAVPAFGNDPSLLVADVARPDTLAYLAAHCPDLAASGVGDAI